MFSEEGYSIIYCSGEKNGNITIGYNQWINMKTLYQWE